MDKNSVIRIIKEFKEALESNNIHVAKIILFGSYAKGLSQFGSDIDLIVISESFKKKTIFQRADMIAEAIYIVRAPIEALALTPSEWAIKQKKLKGFAKEGIEVK